MALRSLIHHPVDVRVLNDAPLAFRYHVLKGQPLLVIAANTQMNLPTANECGTVSAFACRYYMLLLAWTK